MNNQNRMLESSFQLALKASKFNRTLLRDSKDYVLCRQFLNAATSVGANLEEAFGAESKPDFIHKLSAAYKESRETDYWLRLLFELYPQHSKSIVDLQELNMQVLKMTYSSIRTSKGRATKS